MKRKKGKGKERNKKREEWKCMKGREGEMEKRKTGENSKDEENEPKEDLKCGNDRKRKRLKERLTYREGRREERTGNWKRRKY